LELGDVAVHQEEAYPDETIVAGRLDRTFVDADSAQRRAPSES